MFTKSLEQSINQAFADAREKHHEFITVEHLLLALLDNQENITRIDIVNFMTQGISKHSRGRFNHFGGNLEETQPQQDPGLQRETSAEENLIENYTVNLNELAINGKLNPLIGREEEIQR